MAATVSISESNTSSQTITASITNTNMGSVDAKNLVAADYPVVAGENTFEKWQRFNVTAMGGSSKIDDLRVWRTGSLGGSATHKANLKTSAYAGAATFATPKVANSTLGTTVVPTSAPASANLGIGGSLTGSLTSTGYSDYLVHQIQTDAGDTAGSTTTLNFQYSETA